MEPTFCDAARGDSGAHAAQPASRRTPQLLGSAPDGKAAELGSASRGSSAAIECGTPRGLKHERRIRVYSAHDAGPAFEPHALACTIAVDDERQQRVAKADSHVDPQLSDGLS